jgi:hypothetical protein
LTGFSEATRRSVFPQSCPRNRIFFDDRAVHHQPYAYIIAFVAPRTVTQSAGSYYFVIVVVIIRYKPTAAARWASLFIIRAYFNNAFTITVWTRFLCHVDASESLACGLTTTPEKK